MKKYELKKLAEAATPGPWSCNYAGGAKRGEQFKITEFYVYAPETQDDTAVCADVIDPVTQEPSEANAAYIAAANPAAILELLAINAELVEALKLIAAQDQGCGGNVTEAEAWRASQHIARAALAKAEGAKS